MKNLKLYAKKDNFEGFIAEVYVKDNKVVVESKDRAVKEILEEEINEAIKKKGGLWVPTGGNDTRILIDDVKIWLDRELGKGLKIKILEDKDGKAEEILKKINEIQKNYRKKLREGTEKTDKKVLNKTLKDYRKKVKEKIRKELNDNKKYYWKQLMKKSEEIPAFYFGFFRKELVDEIIDQLKADGYKVKYLGGSHYHGYKFIKINDPNFMEAIKGICFAQWSDNFGKYHPALAAILRNIGYNISIEKSLIIEE